MINTKDIRNEFIKKYKEKDFRIIGNKVQQSKNSSSTNNTDPNNPNATTGENGESTEEELTDNQEIEDIQNGYGDINFDANGAIVHGSVAIETSPDMADTLIAMEENPLEKYLEDETGIVEAVQKLLDGDMFDELHNKVMNYDAITIEPKSTTTTEITSTTPTTDENAANGTDGNNSNSQSGNNNSNAANSNSNNGGG